MAKITKEQLRHLGEQMEGSPRGRFVFSILSREYRSYNKLMKAIALAMGF